MRGRLTQLSKSTEEDKPLLGHLMYVAAQVRGWRWVAGVHLRVLGLYEQASFRVGSRWRPGPGGAWCGPCS